MPHLETRLARRLGRLRQPRRAAGRARHLASARAHGVQGHRRAAPRARSPRRSRRSAATSTPRPASRPPPITRACSRPTCRSRSTSCPTSSPIRRSIRTSSQREQNVIVQEIGAAEDTPDDLVFDHLQETAFPGPAGRPLDPRHAARRVRSFDRRKLARLSRRATIARPTWWSRRPARSIIGAVVARGRAALCELRRPGGAGAGAGALRRRRRISRRASSSRCTSRSALQGVPQRDPDALQPAGLHQRARRRHVVAAVPGGARDPRALLLDLCLPRALFRHRHVRRSMPAPTPTDVPELMRVVVDEIDASGRHASPRPRSRAPRRR